MAKFLMRRLLQSILVVIGVTFLSFVSLFLSGDPTYLYVSERASEAEIAQVRAQLGFDQPLHVQYLTYVTKMLRGDFGSSLQTRTAVLPLVLERLPATIELTLFAMMISLFVAIPIGIIAALRRGTATDGAIMLVAMLGQSMPSFWLGIMLLLFVGLQLKLLPISGHVAILRPIFNGTFEWNMLQDALRHLILPSITVGAFSLARNARLVRSSMLEVLPQEYVTTARAKGLYERRVVMRHAFRNALIPIVTVLGLEFGFLISGVVITETVFSWPGIGRLVFSAISAKDIPLVQASVVFFSLIFIVVNLLVDILYAWLDPRIRLS